MKSDYAPRGATGRRVPVLGHPGAIRPVRKVVTKRTKRVVGYLASVKMRALVPWESQLEYDFLRLLEVDNAVVAFHAQPEVLRYQYEGRTRRYCPDVRIQCIDGSARIVEVKCQADADDPDNKALFALFRELYAERGISYSVVTEFDIRRQPLLDNAKLMLEDRDRIPSEQLKLLVAEVFAVRCPAKLGELEVALGFPPERRGDLFGMALRGHFDIDLKTGPLSADSPITGSAQLLGNGAAL